MAGISELGIAKNGNISFDIIRKLVMPGNSRQMILLKKKDPAMIQTHSARERSYLKVENETFILSFFFFFF